MPVIKLHSAFSDPSRSTDDLLELIQANSRFAELLVELANAALFGAGAKRVTELRGAVSLLGRPIIRASAVAFAVQRMRAELRLRSIAAPLMELWRTSLGVACIGQVVARRTKIKSEDAFFTGLLHGIGYLYVMARSIGKSSALGTDLLGHDLIGKTHPSIGKAALGMINCVTGAACAAWSKPI
jgi:HD-like signal output (HDOD) protein